MDEVTFQNYRCFLDQQTVRLAPLTLLVGENSTGKTSFLALLRALWDVGYGGFMPSFRKPPYDLGTFRDIVYRHGSRQQATMFHASFQATLPTSTAGGDESALNFLVDFTKHDVDPFPRRRRYSSDATWVEIVSEPPSLRFGTARGSWQLRLPDHLPIVIADKLFPIQLYLSSSLQNTERSAESIACLDGTTSLPEGDDIQEVQRLAEGITLSGPYGTSPYAGAPVRSNPLRIYGSAKLGADPQGEYIPLYLASVRYSDREEWTRLRKRLETFGRLAGLFEGLEVKPLDNTEGGPFQLHVRRSRKKGGAQQRNIVDVGYGVSQVLPVVTELLRRDTPPMFLLQQPEVHLHPSAQAALGSLFCTIAKRGKIQLVVETHSDHIVDRVRMDVRDQAADLSPEDVVILYFQRVGAEVHVHSLRLDHVGNVLDAPASYRQFFLNETARSLGL